MKNLGKNQVFALLLIAMLLGCDKKEKPLETLEKSSNKEEISITKLKAFMATSNNINIDSISYNPKNQQFIWRGIDQISKASLLEIYKQNVK